MKKHYRIKKKSEIDAVFKKRKQVGNSYFSVFKEEQEGMSNFKFGMSIGRKYGNAVSRNKIKRQVRSIIRQNKNLIKNKYKFIIVIKPKANILTYKQIEIEIIKLLNKIKIMERQYEK